MDSATDFIGTRTHGETSTGVLDGADPNSVILGLIVVANYAIGIAAEAMHCSRAEIDQPHRTRGRRARIARPNPLMCRVRSPFEPGTRPPGSPGPPSWPRRFGA